MRPHTLFLSTLLSHAHVKICIPQTKWCILPLNCMPNYVTYTYKSYKAECRGFFFFYFPRLRNANLAVRMTVGFRLAQPCFVSSAIRRRGPAGTMLGCFGVASGALVWVGGQASPFPLCSQAANLFPRRRLRLWWPARQHGAETTSPARLCYIRK